MMERFGLLLISVFIFSGSLFADTPLPGIEMPREVHELLVQMEETSQDANLARMMQARKERMLSGDISNSYEVLSVTQMAVPLLIGTYSNSQNSYSLDQFKNQIFEDNPTGTMVEYYREVSYGQLELQGDTFGWYDAPQSQTYYVGSQYGLTGGGARFAYDLVVASDAAVDYSKYDNDGDGYVDVLMVVHTGPGAETQPSSSRDNIWSHRWNFYSAHYFYPSIMPEGVYTTNDPWPGHPGQFIKINDYIIQPEQKSHYDSGLIDIGVFCHEFGHALGLPDLYDTDYSSAGIGNWCLMATGSYGGDGYHPHKPAHMSAWCKEELGWINPITVTEDLSGISIPNVQENKNAVYKIWKDGVPGKEYFLVENRQKIGFDQYLYSPGLLVWHIDQNIIDGSSSSNQVNSNESHKGVDLEEADGRNDLDNNYNRGDAGDIFPGSSEKTSFTASTFPNSKSYSGADTGVEINSISLSGNLVIADLIIGIEGESGDGQLTVYNDGSETLDVNDILADKMWLSASPQSFSLAPGASRVVDLTIDWNQLSDQEASVLAIQSNDPQAQTVSATITAVPEGVDGYILTVSVDTIEISPGGGMASFQVANEGGGTLNWSSAANDQWLEITDGHGGANQGTVQVAYEKNESGMQRLGSVKVQADDDPTVNKQVTFVQEGAVETCAATWENSLLIQDGLGNNTTLHFGQGENTSGGLDPDCGETELPPVPPSEIFDARFQLSGTQGTLADFRHDAEEEPVWTIKLQPGVSSSNITFSWNKSSFPEGSFTLLDAFGGVLTNVNMKNQSSFVLSNKNVTTLQIKYTGEITDEVTMNSGWNLISIPLSVSDMSVASIFPDASSATAYAYANGFIAEDKFELGKGYWLKFKSQKIYGVTGYQELSTTVEVNEGWNLIGPFANSVSVSTISSSPADIIESSFFGFNNGYFTATNLEPGKGYWVKVKQNGMLVLGSTNKVSAGFETQGVQQSAVRVSDASGFSTTLYFTNETGFNAASELPPMPPAGIADVRFANGKVAGLFGDMQQLKFESMTFPVKLQALSQGELELALGRNTDFSSEILITKPVPFVEVVARTTNGLPHTMALEQNYPNPFNPETAIRFTISDDATVQLNVYNNVGQLVDVVLNERRNSGEHTVQFRANGLSSGIYFYTLQVDGIVQAKRKMILMR